MRQLPVPAALNGTKAPLIPKEPSPAALPELTVPPHVLLKLGAPKTFMPAGKISLSVAVVMAVEVDGLVITNVRVVGVLATIVLGLKLLVSVGAASRTARTAEAATVLPPPSSVLKNPVAGVAGMLLV